MNNVRERLLLDIVAPICMLLIASSHNGGLPKGYCAFPLIQKRRVGGERKEVRVHMYCGQCVTSIYNSY